MDKLLELNLKLFDEAKEYMKRNWDKENFGSLEDKDSTIYDYMNMQTKHKGSMMWQELLLIANDNLEKKYKYAKEKRSEINAKEK